MGTSAFITGEYGKILRGTKTILGNRERTSDLKIER